MNRAEIKAAFLIGARSGYRRTIKAQENAASGNPALVERERQRLAHGRTWFAEFILCLPFAGLGLGALYFLLTR